MLAACARDNKGKVELRGICAVDGVAVVVVVVGLGIVQTRRIVRN